MSADERHVSAPRPRIQGWSPTLLKIADFLVVGLCTVAFALNAAGLLTSLLTNGFAGHRDFLTYWCSGVQLVHHQNPYDGVAIGVLERSVGFSPSLQPLIMRNAPYALVMVYPLGFFSLRVASLVWSACLIAAAWFSVRMIAEIYGGKGKRVNLLAFAFAPILSCLISGQMALFPLLGLTLFLRFQRTRPFIGGACLWLCTLKPQNFVPFAVVLILWCLIQRNWQILCGAATALLVTSSLVLGIDSSAWHQYLVIMKAASSADRLIPCLSTMVRLLINPGAIWLQWMPVVVACCWAVGYLALNRRWDWLRHSRLLMLVSVVAAPYSWFMDQSVLLPALMSALYMNDSRPAVISFALISAGIEYANIFGVPLGNRVLYPWTACIWLVWYLWTTSSTRSAKESATGQPLQVTSVF